MAAFASIDFHSFWRNVEVALDVLRGRALGRRADDDAALLRGDRLDDVAQADALVVVEASGDAQAFAARDEDDEAARERDLGGQPRALRLHRVLDGLDEDLLVALEEVLDLAAAAALELGRDDLVDVQEAVLLEADLDERGLHAREDVVDGALVDVARDRAALRALEVDLGGTVVLDHGDALLADVDRDEELALRLRQRRAALRLTAPLLLLALGTLALVRCAGLRSGFFSAGFFSAALGSSLAVSVAVAEPAGLRRLRPPRDPRRRLGLVDVGCAPASAGGWVTSGGAGGGAVSLGAFSWRGLRRNNFSKRNLLVWRARRRHPKGGARAACVVGTGHRNLGLRLAAVQVDTPRALRGTVAGSSTS